MNYFLITAVILAAISLGIFILLLIVYSAWLNGGFNVLIPGLGLIVSAPLILAVLAAVEIFISLLLFFVVRRLRVK